MLPGGSPLDILLPDSTATMERRGVWISKSLLLGLFLLTRNRNYVGEHREGGQESVPRKGRTPGSGGWHRSGGQEVPGMFCRPRTLPVREKPQSGYLLSHCQQVLGGHTVYCKALFYWPTEVQQQHNLHTPNSLTARLKTICQLAQSHRSRDACHHF